MTTDWSASDGVHSRGATVLVQNKTKCKIEATVDEHYFKCTVPPGDTVELHAPKQQFTVNVAEISEIENHASTAGLAAGGLTYIAAMKVSDEGKDVDSKKGKESDENDSKVLFSALSALAVGAAAFGAVKAFAWATKRTGSLVCTSEDKFLVIAVTEADDGSFCLQRKQGEQVALSIL